MKYKGFTKLMVQLITLTLYIIAVSFFRETEFWSTFFMDTYISCANGNCHTNGLHEHMNYRGIVYTISGAVLFIITIIRIIMSHKEADFKKG